MHSCSSLPENLSPFSPSRPLTVRETIKQLFKSVIKSIYECDGARAPLNTNEQLHLEKNRGSTGHSGLHKAPIVSLPEKAERDGRCVCERGMKSGTYTRCYFKTNILAPLHSSVWITVTQCFLGVVWSHLLKTLLHQTVYK